MTPTKVKITKIFRGKQKTKYGERNKIAIKTEQHGDKWLSSFQTKGTEVWKEGDEVDIFVEEKSGYLNFRVNIDLKNKIQELERRIKALEDACFGNPDDYDKF